MLRQHNDSQVAGHWGRHRTQELVSRIFICHRWSEDVANYVAGCIKCHQSKADRHSRQTKLIPMPTGERHFVEIAMDFVGELPESEGCDAILVVTDRLTKVQHYLPANPTWTAADVANSHINDIWLLHVLPRHITCDRGPPFASKFCNDLNRKLNNNLCLATAYHPQRDRLSERAVQTRSDTSASTAMIGKTAGEHCYLLTNLPTIPQLPPPMVTLPTEACMTLTHAQYTSITTTNSLPPPQKNC